MDKAIIFGAFEFVGFYLCKEFLEKGYEVTGILLDHSAKNDVEEKRFEFGRNANFKEKTIEEWGGFEYDDTSNSLIILSLYDLFMGSKEKVLNCEVLNKPLFQNNGNENQLICLLPVQILNQSLHSNEMNDLRPFLEKIKEIRKPIQFYYLPSIFGPWQPNEFVFQKSMLNILKENEEQRQKREWMMDAIFVEDAIKTIIDKIETGGSGKFILESGLTNHWEECANFLKINPQFRQSTEPQELILDDHIIRLTVQNVTPISDSLTMQRDHLKYLQSLFN
jgi:hypothetical protein